MRRVFAVLFFLAFLCVCMSKDNQNIQEINSTFKNNTVYTATGDFDGDKKSENIFITEFDNIYHLNLIKSGKVYNCELGFKIDNFNSTIQDVNNDTKEELILNVIQDNCENCFVFAFTDGFYDVLSPELITEQINFKKLEKTITYNKKSTASDKIIHSVSSKIKLYYTEMDYTEEEPIFNSEGIIYNNNKGMFNIKISSKINNNNQIILCKIQVNPLNN